MKVFYLQMLALSDLVAASAKQSIRLQVIDPPDGAVNQRFYREVGSVWGWSDRAPWALEQWQTYVQSGGITTVVIDAAEGEIGYGELKNAGGEVEIANYGLLPAFIGQGFGGAALVEVVRLAWSLPGASRVWLHTCEGDHPNALNNYRRRGFRLFRTEEEA